MAQRYNKPGIGKDGKLIPSIPVENGQSRTQGGLAIPTYDGEGYGRETE